ncbi:uncharacterized protein LOC112504353 [Cynara cardunculus var. scolymus]|uniref:uncharacterized protein LOC112504353 n=1 Tax=Cynara cardunculus var. scolymus TaxID=59895 RepID=UPI000D6247AF|nr:uncharacterized protein LOC112504353 [Cynara cardunculus var. scolymus]
MLKKDSVALQVWNNLKTLFRDSKDAKSMQIDSELRNIVMANFSVTAYCTKIKGLADLLTNLDPDSTVPDKHLVIYTINGLSSKFDSVAIIIRYRSPLPTFFEARSMLLLEEQRMALIRLTPVMPHIDHSSSSTVLHVNNNGGNRGNGRRNDHRQQQGRRQQPSNQPRYG